MSRADHLLPVHALGEEQREPVFVRGVQLVFEPGEPSALDLELRDLVVVVEDVEVPDLPP